MPEIRLGAGENLADIQLGSNQVEEVRLGQILVWRNNVAPFFGVLVNGVQVSTNGVPMGAVDPVTPANAVLTTFGYTDNIVVSTMNLVDEDMHYPVAVRVYEGDFDADDTLPVIATGSAAGANIAVNLTLPRGPLPTGPTAANFIFANRLYSIVAEDAEEGLSIQYFRITRNDEDDNFNNGPFSNFGGIFNPRIDSSTSAGTGVRMISCVDPMSQNVRFTVTRTQPVASQNQIRTCAVVVVGIPDTPPLVCGPAQTNRTVTVNNGAGSVTQSADINVGGPFVNAGFVAPIGTATGSRRIVATATVQGGCISGALINTPCAGTLAMCTQNDGSQTDIVTTTLSDQPTNCLGQDVGGATVIQSTNRNVVSNCSYTYPNPAALPRANAITVVGGLQPLNQNVGQPGRRAISYSPGGQRNTATLPWSIGNGVCTGCPGATATGCSDSGQLAGVGRVNQCNGSLTVPTGAPCAGSCILATGDVITISIT